ncbi:MAG TPA: BlaI/MecI/CopY family transcriptional regulator [Mariniphaga sp.]|nr:BlaI/MecI/CopY family transcriptional regulator [Mariniphaga sp.]
MTEKEEAIINYFWRESELFVYQLRKKYLDPKSHYNTLSTFVRKLEVKAYLSHKKIGNTYLYFAITTKEEYGKFILKKIVDKHFGGYYQVLVKNLID